MNQIPNQVVAGALLAFFIQWLKRSSLFPWITTETSKLNRYVAIGVSGLAALGIRIICSKVNHECSVSWTDGLTIASGLWHWAAQFVFTHSFYMAVVKPGSVSTIEPSGQASGGKEQPSASVGPVTSTK